MPDQQILWTALPRAAGAQHCELDAFVSPRLGVAAAADRFTLADFPELVHWTRTLDDRLSFAVELDDGSRVAAEIVPAALDHDAWDHLFPTGTFVRPWSFRDLSQRRIYSFPVRFVTAYLRDLYRDVGRRFPRVPPPLGELGGLVGDLGPITDQRVPEEREPPPRDPGDLPLPVEPPQPPPPSAPQGCLAFLFKLLRPLWELVRKLLHLPPLTPTPPPPPDPTRPTVPVPNVVHPSPYGAKPPLGAGSNPALDALEAQMATSKAIPPSASHGPMAAALAARDPTFDFTRAHRFYDRPETVAAARPVPPELDFHQALGALGDYPALLRSLGLVVRLRFARPATDPASVRIVPSWDGAERATDVTPRTRCTLAPDRFAAAERAGSDLAGGLLDLEHAGDRLAADTPRFDVVQVDSDGAALKAILTAATLSRRTQLDAAGLLGIDLPDEHGMPALRSGGLAIVRPDRAHHVHRHLVDAASLVAGGDLHAEDLLRGYRIEVAEAGGEWRSLCWRVGSYRLVDATGGMVRELPPVTDEGYVKSTSAASGSGADAPLYVHEALARWTGWSLAVPRPGNTLANAVDGPAPDGEYEHATAPRSDARPELRLETSFAPKPGSLPRLRFGRRYALRAVGADLAGGRLGEPAAGSAATDLVTFRRFEPAGPPAALALRPFWPGESLERIVVRSDFDRDPATFAQQAMGAAAPEARAHRTRHLFPPKAAQQMVELHGKLDVAFGPGGDPDAGYRISLRESGDFTDALIYDVDNVDVHTPVRTIPFGTPQLIEPPDGGAHAVNRTDATLPTPYLPDPLAAGIALRGLPGLVDHVDGDPLTVVTLDDGPLLQIPFEGSWPDLLAPRLRVTEGAGPPRWDADDRVLVVSLPKGEQRRVRVSCFVGEDGLALNGVWDWIDGGDAPATLRTRAAAGAHWMISPSREIVLVHAVQHPVRTAHFTALVPTRTAIGQTTAELSGTLDLDVASTGRIDVIGEWDDPTDDPTSGVVAHHREAVACDVAVQEDWSEPAPFPPPGGTVQARHEFGDTRHRMVEYRVRATSRFREYMPAGTTDVWRDSDAGERITVNVLSSARPPAPRVRHAVPTFAWPSPPPAAGWAQHTQERGGGGLRIYLDRPWHASGPGELLAVVMSTVGSQPLPDELRSRYGLDPTTRGVAAPATEPLEPKHFVNRIDEATGLTVAERAGVTATIAAFAPVWDAGRGLWFADLELAVGTLPWTSWPFVRLALARYQPNALPDAKLSPIAIGEFAQVAPDRRLSLTWQDPSHLALLLRGRAPVAPHEPRVALRVQTTAAVAPDELDWEHASGPPPVIDAPAFFQLVGPSDPDSDGDVSWEAVVELPMPRAAAPMRLEVAEYELLRADSEWGRGLPRVTYAAHVPLD